MYARADFRWVEETCHQLDVAYWPILLKKSEY